jgi:hypothetical protein
MVIIPLSVYTRYVLFYKYGGCTFVIDILIMIVCLETDHYKLIR